MKKSKFFELFVTKNDERVHSLCLIHHAQVLNKICVSNCALKCEKQSNRREIRENQKKHLKTTSGRKGLNRRKTSLQTKAKAKAASIISYSNSKLKKHVQVKYLTPYLALGYIITLVVTFTLIFIS